MPSAPISPSDVPGPSRVASDLRGGDFGTTLAPKRGPTLDDNNNVDKPLLSVNLDPTAVEAIDAADEVYLEKITAALIDLAPPNSAASAYLNDYETPDEKLTRVAKILAALSYRMYGAAATKRVEQSEIALGGDRYAQDRRDMEAAKLTYDLPHQMEDVDVACLKEARELMSEFGKKQLKRIKTKMGSLITCEAATTEGAVVAKTDADIRASAKDVVAYWMGHSAQYRADIDADIPILKEPVRIFGRTPRHVFVYQRYNFPYPLTDRDLLAVAAWEKLSDKVYFIGVVSASHPDHPPSTDHVRMTVTRAIAITELKPNIARVESTSYVNLGGKIPANINNSFTLPEATTGLLKSMNYFSAVRLRDEYNEGDANELGQLFIINFYGMHPEDLAENLIKAISRITILRNAQAKYRFVDELLFHVMRNKMIKAAFTVRSPLSVVTGRDASMIGRSLSNVLMSSIVADAAVDEWILMYPALVEFDDEFAWFRPMMNGIAGGLLKKAKYGVAYRAYTGALFSILDMASDTNVIYIYFQTDQDAFAWGLISMVLLNLLFQMAVAFLQTKGRGEGWWRVCLMEWMYVLTFTKPGVDAWRVASGVEKQPGAMVTPLSEMLWSKNAEMFCEAIPGMIIQSVALISSSDRTPEMVFSLLTSACSAAMISTNTAYDLDTNPTLRRNEPESSGMIPDTSRGVAYGFMFGLAVLQIMAKCMATALMIVTSSRWLIYYMILDHGLMFAYKALTQDFFYWTPMSRSASLVFTVFMRMIVKTITDYSASLISRTPNILGGSYWLFNFVMNQVTVLVSVYLYNENGADDSAKISPEMTWTIGISLITALVLTFLFFLYVVIVPRYRRTFWSTQTSCQFIESIFFDHINNDEKRVYIFKFNVLKWKRIAGEVKAWSHASWETWVAEAPEWFTPVFVAGVPDEFIPPEFLNKLGGKQRERRGSAAQSIRESVQGIGLGIESPVHEISEIDEEGMVVDENL